MATASYSLAPNPKWYVADLVGRPLGGGYLATFSSLDHTLLNPVFQDSAGLFTWPYVSIPHVSKLGILFDENGSQGPFYWKFDTAIPDQLYYLEVYDSDGVLQWTIDDFSPDSAGGGTIITTVVNIDNLVTNSAMLRNSIGETAISTATFMKVAPGAHSGLAQTLSNAGPDIVFLKNNLNATDTINFVRFAQGETFPNGEPTPIDYLHYSCSVLGAGETQKCVQFPITHGVQNIQNQAVTISIFARCTAGNPNLTLNWMQFFGNGPSASVPAVKVSAIQVLTLTSAWQKFVISPPGANVPSTTGESIGECGNDGLFLQIEYPLTVTTTIDFTLPSVFMGIIVPGINFIPNDMAEAPMYTPRTGYVIPEYETSTIGGFIPLNDGSIGQSGSGGTTRQNIDTFPLYNLLYTNVTIPSGNTLCFVAGFTGNAINDFVTAKKMELPKSLGRALCAAGAGAGLTSRALGSIVGAESHSISINELPEHTHNDPGSQFVINANAGSPFTLGGSGGKSSITGGITGHGGQTPLSLMQPSSFMNFFIKL